MRFTSLSVALISMALSAAGCTVLVDGTLAGRTGTDAGTQMDTGIETDSGPPVGACTGMADGIRCMPDGIIEPFVCIDEVCVLSTCGDGARDDRSGSMHDEEECDDGNSSPDDGCDPDCTFSCTLDSECDDLEVCTGVETCDTATHACVPGMIAADGFGCIITGTAEEAACRGGLCRAGACPDGIVNSGEECDPAATPVDGDGCEDDCTFTCTEDFDCADGDACNGNEACDVGTHTCLAAPDLPDCDDADVCTTDSCDTALGCVNTSVLVDADGDGHFLPTGACGGDDCDDGNAARYPGATEACGASMDLNCDGMTGTTPVFYRDCDGDDYAASTSGSVTACTEPAVVTGCTGGWTRRTPGTGATDCLDTSVGSSVNPGQSGWFSTNPTGLSPSHDYNCSGSATREFPLVVASGSRPPVSIDCAVNTRDPGTCIGEEWWVASSPPPCGSTTGQLSRCVFYPARFTIPPTAADCDRETVTTTVRCH